jgi:RNA ligase
MAHVTDLGFTMDELGDAIDAGDVRVQTHPEFPELCIFNYTEATQFSKKWNNITLQCRGLILNNRTGEIVARPWEKFFNLGERDNRIDFNGPVEVTDKMDGSLGILYQRPDGAFAIATRGSFASAQAVHATALLGDKYGYLFDYETGIGGQNAFGDMVRNYTYLFEIIYPDNRIVCNYGKMDDLVLLGGVQKERGYYVGPFVAAAMLCWDGPTTEVFNYATFGDAISAKDREGAEGIVIRSGSKMVKLKQADYVELHRIVTNLSPRTIWAQLGEGKTAKDICDQIPDEFHSYVETISNNLIEQASDLLVAIWNEFNTLYSKTVVDGVVIRKRFAKEAAGSSYKAYLFKLLDGKDITDQVWKSLRPTGDAKLVEDDA